MIKDGKILLTDWDAIYQAFNKEIGADIFEEACADEWPLINYWKYTQTTDIYEQDGGWLAEWFMSHYEALWFDPQEGQSYEVDKNSAEYYEGEIEHRKFIMNIATYINQLWIIDQLFYIQADVDTIMRGEKNIK